jgi:hypothetical protein
MNMMFFNTRQPTSMNGRMPLVNRNVAVQNSTPYQQLGRTQQQALVHQTMQEPILPKNEMKWGAPTWFLLHTLSVKIKENEFQRIRTELLNNIYGICVNLPCPDCSNHAKTYLDNVNFNTIQTKAHLIMLLYKFHNDVNKMKGYSQFPFEQLHEKYSLAITNNIIRNFMAHFSDRNRSKKLLATDLSRANLCNVLKNWFNMNIHAFDQ